MKFTFIQKKSVAYKEKEWLDFVVVDGNPWDYFFLDYKPEVERLSAKKFAWVPIFTTEWVSKEQVKTQEAKINSNKTPREEFKDEFGTDVPRNIETDEEIVALMKEKREQDKVASVAAEGISKEENKEEVLVEEKSPKKKTKKKK